MSPAEWMAALAPEVHWKVAYGVVAKEARAYLETAPAGVILTADLVEALLPLASSRGTARARLFKALNVLESHDLKDCVTLAEPRQLYGNQVYRRFWHKPIPVETCLCCGQPLPPTT